jgi:hypothetical protein
MATEPFGQPVFFDFVCRQSPKNNDALHVVGLQPPVVQVLKSFRYQIGGSFVSIYERMITYNAVGISCGQLSHGALGRIGIAHPGSV